MHDTSDIKSGLRHIAYVALGVFIACGAAWMKLGPKLVALIAATP